MNNTLIKLCSGFFAHVLLYTHCVAVPLTTGHCNEQLVHVVVSMLDRFLGVDILELIG